MNKFVLLVFCSFLISCAEHENKKSNINESAIYWRNASIIKNKALISYLDSYLVNHPSDLLMYIGQYRDTIIATISQLKLDINVNQMQPLGYMILNGKKIYILMPISHILENDTSSEVQRNFQLSIDSIIAKKHYVYSNRVLLKFPMFSDTLIESKDIERTSFYFQPTIKSD